MHGRRRVIFKKTHWERVRESNQYLGGSHRGKNILEKSAQPFRCPPGQELHPLPKSTWEAPEKGMVGIGGGAHGHHVGDHCTWQNSTTHSHAVPRKVQKLPLLVPSTSLAMRRKLWCGNQKADGVFPKHGSLCCLPNNKIVAVSLVFLSNPSHVPTAHKRPLKSYAY